ncbi:MAG: hypothetical protein JRE16_06160 [Deltaproteobacteria bacterium]|nr:hypothetical protein [Deltaproteobacteria bacterium]MBW2504139.1 hypothetical protein [Deltaproteobacteria bacterium]
MDSSEHDAANQGQKSICHEDGFFQEAVITMLIRQMDLRTRSVAATGIQNPAGVFPGGVESRNQD